MQRKITRLARAGKCVACGANPPSRAAAAASCANPANAKYPNPEAQDFNICRRETSNFERSNSEVFITGLTRGFLVSTEDRQGREGGRDDAKVLFAFALFAAFC
jgi:hypothetical protein